MKKLTNNSLYKRFSRVFLIVLILTISLFSINFVYAVSNLDIPLPTALSDSYGTFRLKENVELVQTCSNETSPCDVCNISSLRYPDGTVAVVDVEMTKNTVVFNYTLSGSLVSLTGKYAVTGFCIAGETYSPWAYTFDITGTGIDLTEGKAILYIGFIAVLVFLFVVNIAGIPLLPSGNKSDGEYIIGINHLKHLKWTLYFTAYLLLLAILFISSGVALNYLEASGIGSVLFVIYRILFLMLLPMVLLWFIGIFLNVFKDRETKRMIERGVPLEKRL
jgi:hypothetical protein